MKIQEIRKFSDKELQKQLTGKQETLMNARFRKVTSTLKNVSEIRILRRDIAGIKTVIRERQIIAELYTGDGEEEQE